MVKVFLSHGLAPRSVVAVRPAGRPTPTCGAVAVRPAGLDDIEPALALELESLSWDNQFGAAFPNPGSADAVRSELATVLSAAPRWAWVASIDGETVGFLRVQPPDAATWIAPMVGLEPAGYVAVMSVTAQQRGGGAGSALMTAAHAEFDRIGVAVSVLHYAALSPLSGPFWHRCGYRPLWTSWQARPTSMLR
jgi:GNAT superfamily N-acetyltransferase